MKATTKKPAGVSARTAPASAKLMNYLLKCSETNRKPKNFRPTRGRPSTEQAAAIDRAILNIATEQFLELGYNAASMDAIAATAGISKGTLYSRYSNKEALMRAVAEDKVASWSAIASMKDWLLGDTIEERLKHCATSMMSWAVSPEIQTFNRLMIDAPETMRAHREILYDSMINFLTKEIREYTRKDGRPARNPRHIAVTLMAAIGGWMQMERHVKKVSEREAIKFANDVVDLLIAGRSGW